MKSKVEINILAALAVTDTIKEDVHIHGRLLGVVSPMEATKILQNDEVSSRIATAETVSLADTLKGLETIQKTESGRAKYGRLVVAITAMKAETDKELTQTLTRQLFVSAPITLISETKEEADGLTRATLTCNDDSLIMINEKDGTIDEKEITNE